MKKKKELTVIKRILQRINFMRKHLDYYTFKDMEQSEYKWAENSNVNAAWNSEVGAAVDVSGIHKATRKVVIVCYTEMEYPSHQWVEVRKICTAGKRSGTEKSFQTLQG